MLARDALRVLEETYGYLDAALVVEQARPVDSDLHPYIFDKDQEEAAEAWYLHKAQELIQSVRVKYQKGDEVVEVRRYVSVVDPDRNRRVYRDSEKVALDPIQRELVLREMRRDIAAMRERYKQFQEFWQLVVELSDQAPV